MTPSTIELIESATGRVVTAVVRLGLTQDELDAVEVVWSAYRSPFGEHADWDWGRKGALAGQPGMVFVALEYDQTVQGLAWIQEGGWTARVGRGFGQPVLYVANLEAAPWNDRGQMAVPRFRGVGRGLLRVAVGRSRELGWAGRVGLHSLPQVEGFYEDGCDMLRLGPDAGYNQMTYFEFITAIADVFHPPGGTP